MEKYAVVEAGDQEALEKVAAQGCPLCGSSLDKHGMVLWCPKHGTQPFEGTNGREEERKGRQR